MLHLAITRTRELMAELAPEYGPDCPVVVVYRASQPQERVLRGTVADIADARRGRRIAAGRSDPCRPGAGGHADPDAGESHLYDPDRDRSAQARGAC